MKVLIRHIESKDHSDVIEILRDSGFETMEESDIENDTLVAELDGRVVGCFWCLIGKSTTAYMGYFATRNEEEVQKARVASTLMFETLQYLRRNGITKVIGILMGNVEHRMASIYTKMGRTKICGRYTVVFNDNIDFAIRNIVKYFHYVDTQKNISLDDIELEPIKKRYN